MAKKRLGYTKLEWVCPNCSTRNPGPKRLCTRCGAPQPADVEFVQPAQEDLIADATEIAKAKRGPDIHCAYCGTRNPAGSANCSQCGAPLGEGTAREAGGVIGAHRSEPVPTITCSSCGGENPSTATICSHCGASLRATPAPRPVSSAKPAGPPSRKSIGVIGCLVVVMIAIIVGVFFASQREDVSGYVSSVAWSRSVTVMGLVPVTREAWREDIPANTVVGTCTRRVQRTESEPVAGAREVCGTPYTVDKGSGYAEVVQDCVYEVSADWCKFSAQELQAVDKVVLEGADLNPRWPAPALAGDQQLGDQVEIYQVTFETDGKNYNYRVGDEAEFSRFAVGSKWNLEVNKLGNVVGISPAN